MTITHKLCLRYDDEDKGYVTIGDILAKLAKDGMPVALVAWYIYGLYLVFVEQWYNMFLYPIQSDGTNALIGTNTLIAVFNTITLAFFTIVLLIGAAVVLVHIGNMRVVRCRRKNKED